MAMKLAATTMGSECWRNRSLRIIKLAQDVVHKSDKSNDIGRAMDPIPHIREIMAMLTNEEIRKYTRDVRVVVAKLREALLDVNEEIKPMNRAMEMLVRAIEHIRKDIRLNLDSHAMRSARPLKEREHDGADDLLDAERAHLLNSKKVLETQLKLIQGHMSTLDRARRSLLAVIQERTRVLDLLCHANSSITNWPPAKDPKALAGNITVIDGNRLNSSLIDALGPYTPSVDRALQDAQDAVARSAFLRRNVRDMIDEINKLQQAAHKSVNDGLTQKVAETETLKQHLDITFGENRHAIFRSQRWFDTSEHSYGVTLGPMMYDDLLMRERLNRPMVKVFQRHPGTQMPETKDVITSGIGLLQSMQATSRNIGLMRLTQGRMYDDIRSKSISSAVDSGVVRTRKAKANHKWPLGEPF